jgi:hypothetical protein
MPLDAPARNAVFLHSDALKPGIILPLNYEAVRFVGCGGHFASLF